MKYKIDLAKQNFILAITIFSVIFISVGVVLPKALTPIYEKILYENLSEPLNFVDDNSYNIDTDISYLYFEGNEKVYTNNLKKIIDLTPEQIKERVNNNYGKFKYHGKTYYYYKSYSNNTLKIALTDNSSIIEMSNDILIIIMPILLFTFIIVLTLMLIWSRRTLRRIGYLKRKIENIHDDDEPYTYHVEDEFHDLSIAIDNMKRYLKEEEEYKNQMYQNISHDFKTPLTVISSYIEGMEDGIQEKEEGLNIIKKQVQKLEQKVHSLLYLNKLNYIKDINLKNNDRTDLVELIKSSSDKFKLQRNDVSWKIIIKDKKTTFHGSYDMWEAIVDNILNNFMRYAESEIIITIRNGKITFYNDGPNIDDNILDDVFTPYKKGTKGQFGLGLSIVKKTLQLLGYEISVKNEKKGIIFTIK